MSAGVPQQRGPEMFLVPAAIINNGSLKTLSGNSLALLFAVSHRMYRMRSANVRMRLRDLYAQIELGRSDIQRAAKELRAAGVLHFQQSEHLMAFQLQQSDGSKAQVYLHPPKPHQSVPEIQDANIAQPNIDIAPHVSSPVPCGQ
jgi:hypothetical protein